MIRPAELKTNPIEKGLPVTASLKGDRFTLSPNPVA